MPQKKFTLQLFLFSLFTGLVLLVFNYFPAFHSYWNFSYFTWLFFIVITMIIFFIGNATAKSPNKFAYTRFQLMVILAKLFLCVGVVVGFKEGFQPETISFLWPFLFLYISFTAFETYVLMEIGKQAS